MSAPNAASQTLPLRNCYWVIPGLLLAGEHPNGPTNDKTKDRLKKLLAAGIECFVDLTKPTELLRYDTFLPFYVEYTRKSIKDHGVPSARSQMVEILEHIASSMRAGRPVYVHCRAGIGRTGTVVGCFLAERGAVGNAAIDELNQLWQQCRRSRSWPVIPETDAQARYVREWQPALDGGFELSSLATAVANVGSMSADADVRRLPTAPTNGAGPAGAARRATDAPPNGAGRRATDTPTNGAAGSAASSVGAAGVGKASAGGGPGAPSRSAGAGGGLRAAAEQARAAVERGEVKVKAPPVPVPVSTPTPSGTAGASRGRTVPSNDPNALRYAELSRGEISPSLRAEIADALAGRAHPAQAPGPGAVAHGTAAPNGGEEAPWADSGTDAAAAAGTDAAAASATGAAAASSAGAAGADSLTLGRENGRAAPADESDFFPAEPASRPSGLVSRPDEPLGHDFPPRSDSIGGRPEAPSTTARVADGGFASAGGPQALGRKPPSADADVPPPAAEPDPLLDPDTLEAARGLRERFLGALFGLAVGDAVAAATQLRRPGTFSPVGDMLGGGPFDLPRGAWSDDTAMALCLAESLLERDGFDARDQVQRYSRWQQEGYLSSTGQCVGITANTARSLALAKWRRGAVFPGSHDPEQLDPEPLSRIAPVALFYFASQDATLQQSVDSSRITCQAPAVLDACRTLARVLHSALAGRSKAKILTEAGPINEGASQANTTAAAALNAALWAFSSTDNFRDAVLRAANVGGNSDVVAAVCGQLAGAHYGASAIPPSWRNGLMQKDLVEGIADRLLAHGLVSLSS